MPARKKASKKAKPALAKKKPSAKRNARPKAATPKRAKASARRKAPAKAAAKPKTKPAAKKKKKVAAATAKAKPRVTRRRDATGHLDPRYAAELRAKGMEMHDGTSEAFLTKARSTDDFAEELGEEAVKEMTSGEDQRESLLDQEVAPELGGPFVETRARDEFARGTDASNPRNATREPFPKT